MDELDNQVALDIAQLVAAGGLEMFINEDGTAEYFITSTTKELAPELYDAWLEEVDESIAQLVLKGFVEPAGVDSNGELMYAMTEQGRNVAESFKQFG